MGTAASLRLEMLRAARSAPNLLLEAGDRVAEFLRGQLNEDGGAKDRAGRSDLYYTVFALEGLSALGADPPVEAVAAYLGGFHDGGALDFVHQTCLARCWANLLQVSLDGGAARRLLDHIESHRSADGGYNAEPGAATGTVYHCFLALGAYQDLGQELPDTEGLARCLVGLQTGDGAYANRGGLMLGTTPATAAAATLLRHLDLPVGPAVGDWLLARCHQRGGFLAMPQAPFPDLLSTATALHALAGVQAPLNGVRESCLDFLDSLWTGRAFRGHLADEVADCEYTYYALLALGHLMSG